MTKIELRQLRWTRKRIEALEDRLYSLESEATRITTSTSQTGKGKSYKDKMADIVSQIVEVQDEINHELGHLYAHEKEILRAISTLPEREQCLMTLRYIDNVEWKDICEQMSYSWRQIHRIHAEALRRLL